MYHTLIRREFLKWALTTAGAAGGAALIPKPFLTHALARPNVPTEGDWQVLNPSNPPSARAGHSIVLPGNICVIRENHAAWTACGKSSRRNASVADIRRTPRSVTR